MRRGNQNNWRGLVQPKRDPCPQCGKRGLGPIKVIEIGNGRTAWTGQHCRYCGHIVRC